MNILLIHPNLSVNDTTDNPRFPLGLGYIAAVLQGAGHRITVVDLNAKAESECDLEEIIKAGQFGMVGLRAMITQFQQVKQLASFIRSVSPTKIILGGGLASSVPEMVLKETEVDIAVVGEGEKTVVEVADRMENMQSMVGVKGIVFRNNGNIMKALPQNYIDDISSIPFPAWNLFSMESYFNNKTFGIPKRMISIISSRGCPYNCRFCFHGNFGYKYRFRSAENLFEEIKILKESYDIEGVYFEDDTFFLNKKRILSFCEMLQRHKPNIVWSCSGRVNLIEKDILLRMKAAGCTSISYGIESGSQEMLNRIAKGITVDQARKAIKMTWDCGMIPHGFMMIGYPGETLASVQQSIEFCKDVGIIAEFTFATPIPGTKLYNDALELKRINSLNKLVIEWGHWFEDVLVNMTDFSDNQLIEMKKKAEKEVFNHFLQKKVRYLLKMLRLEFRINGFVSIINRMWRGVRLIVRLIGNKGLSGVNKGKS
ncbi:MAG: B12-binding domain-containing radical SAM protein [Thermodesulfobacteriota bacterium]